MRAYDLLSGKTKYFLMLIYNQIVAREDERIKKTKDLVVYITSSSVPMSSSNVNKKTPLILLYHKLHGAPNWWFSTTEKDFDHCPHICHVTSNRSLYRQADLVLFESPRKIVSNEGDQLRLGYFR